MATSPKIQKTMNNWAQIIIGDSRDMRAVASGSVDLVVTSPPYWHLKDYGVPGQLGYGQTLHAYLRDLYRVWQECFRVLRPGGRFTVNVGDQFARARVYGRYKVIPLHAEIIGQGEQLGFDFMGSIIWRKKTTMHTTGGAVVMGSYPYPPNGLVEIDYEFILIFKKPGPGKRVTREIKEASRLTKEEWKQYFAGHWHFGGARQWSHEAMFPEELPRRLIRMFTFVGDTVLDPFLGSGTTVKVALELGRNAIGYEINEEFLEMIRDKVGIKGRLPFSENIQIIKGEKLNAALPEPDYRPNIRDASPRPENLGQDFRPKALHKVVGVVDESSILLDNGRMIRFFGVIINKAEEMLKYLHEYILGRKVVIRIPDGQDLESPFLSAYVFLKNKIFINRYLISSGLASPDLAIEHPFKSKFLEVMEKRVTRSARTKANEAG